ncbi:hypothetical protein NIES4074_23730 [Cylindrospermum sp. NIES-4074]|nr:hypothetical protein NIES4074_23730 [Cylindrospermum sp. NIES-4074]
MKLKTILLASVTLMTLANPVQAEICPPQVVVRPLQQTKIIRQEQFGYRLRIPNNYKTLSLNSSELLVFDPGNFARTQCLLKNKVPTEFPYHISIYTKVVTSKNRDLASVVRQANPGAEKFANTKVANQNAVTYISNTLGVQKQVSFFTPNNKYIITISTPFNIKEGRPTTIFNKNVFDQVLSSFTFSK